MGTKPVGGLSYYASVTVNQTKMLEDYRNSATTFLATSGKRLPDTPTLMAGASVQYTSGPFLVSLSGKYVGSSYATLVNDEKIDAYTTFDLAAAYKFASSTFFKNPTVRLNMSNILNKRYLLLNAGSGSSFATTTDPTKAGFGTPVYYVGAPRAASVNFSVDF